MPPTFNRRCQRDVGLWELGAGPDVGFRFRLDALGPAIEDMGGGAIQKRKQGLCGRILTQGKKVEGWNLLLLVAASSGLPLPATYEPSHIARDEACHPPLRTRLLYRLVTQLQIHPSPHDSR